MNKIDTIKLDNGLNIYLYSDKRRHSTFFQFTTFCGGITKHFTYDNKRYDLQDGVSHILEHYLVECNDEGNFLDKLGSLNMSTNASTALKTTSYYFETVENVLEGIKIILNGIYNVNFTKEKLDKLKGPIYQEIRGKFDNKFYHANRLRIQNTFHNNDFKDTGGTLEEVEQTTINDLETLYKGFYQPNNQFIVVAGNFDKEEVIKTIKDFYINHPIEEHLVKLIKNKENSSIVKKRDILYFPTPKEYVDITFKIDISKYNSQELLDLDFYINSFYDQFFGNTSDLYKELVDNKIIIDGISCNDMMIDNYEIISIGAYVNNEDIFINKILEIFKNLDSFNEEKFELDKKNSILRLILRDENIFKMVFPFINNIVYYDYPYLDEVKDVEQLSYENFTNKIKEIDFSNYTIMTIKNKD